MTLTREQKDEIRAIAHSQFELIMKTALEDLYVFLGRYSKDYNLPLNEIVKVAYGYILPKRISNFIEE